MAEKEKVYNLLEKVCEGDSLAFSELVEIYTPLLKGALATNRTHEMSDEDAEDLWQEAMVAFYRAILNFDRARENIEFGLYAKICVTNSIISYKRAAAKRASHLPLPEGEDFLSSDGEQNDPAKLYEEKENERILERQIEKTLSSYENEVWCRYVNGSSSREIAKALDSSEKSIDNAIFRIRRKLKILLGK